ncbi:hypothetical protein AB6846_08075 [Serratia proteamaculans]
MTSFVGFPTLRLIRTKIGAIDLVQLGLQPGDQKTIEPLLYPDFKDVPAEEPYRSRSMRRNQAVPETDESKEKGWYA